MADATNTTSSGKSSSSAKAPEGFTRYTVDVPDTMDKGEVEAHLRVLRGPVTTVVGNLADLQRAGAAAANGEASPFKLGKGVEMPPEVDSDANLLSTEDLKSPGPVGLGADAAEEVFGSRVAQGDRNNK